MSLEPGPDTAPPSRSFIFHFTRTILVLLVTLFALLIIVDPFDTLHLSPPLDRSPAATNQRFSYVSLARSARFDSLVLGTSTTRMLDPSKLSPTLGVKLANLSMNSATVWEQKQLQKLFFHHHESVKLVIWGMDIRWCGETKKGPKLTGRAFPHWLYDENPWNDYLHLLNYKVIELAGRQIGNITGLIEAVYGKNGYKSLNKDNAAYDLRKARRNIYKQVRPIAPAKPLEKPYYSEAQRLNWSYPDLAELQKRLIALPRKTRFVLMMTPYHQHYLGAVNGRNWLKYNECKKRVKALSDGLDNVDYVDFMYRNSFTSNDKNYWDHLHFNESGARKIEQALVAFIRDGKHQSPIFQTSLSAR